MSKTTYIVILIVTTLMVCCNKENDVSVSTDISEEINPDDSNNTSTDQQNNTPDTYFNISVGNGGDYLSESFKSDYEDLYYSNITAIPNHGWGFDYFDISNIPSKYIFGIDEGNFFRGNPISLSDVDIPLDISINFYRSHDIINGNPYKNIPNQTLRKSSYDNKMPTLHKNYDIISDRLIENGFENFKINYGNPAYVVLDYNNDNYLDIILPTSIFPEGYRPATRREKVHFFTSSSSGTLSFDENNSNLLDGLFFCSDVEINDFDNDGLIDFLAVGTSDETQPIDTDFQDHPVLFFNNGDGTFDRLPFPELHKYHHGSASGDIDNDGDIDIVLVDSGFCGNPGDIPGDILINNGNRSFTQKNLILNLPYETIGKITSELYDLNNDNYLDLIYGGKKVNQIDCNGNSPLYEGLVVFGNGEDFNSNPIDLPEVENYELILDFDFNDFNGDGLNDIIVTRTNIDYFGFYIQILKNINGVSFEDVTSSVIQDNFLSPEYSNEMYSSPTPMDDSGFFIYDTYIGDINGDGVNELIFNNINRFTRRSFNGKRHPYRHWKIENGVFNLKTDFEEF